MTPQGNFSESWEVRPVEGGVATTSGTECYANDMGTGASYLVIGGLGRLAGIKVVNFLSKKVRFKARNANAIKKEAGMMDLPLLSWPSACRCADVDVEGFTASRVQKFEQRMTSYDITKFNKFFAGCPW